MTCARRRLVALPPRPTLIAVPSPRRVRPWLSLKTAILLLLLVGVALLARATPLGGYVVALARALVELEGRPWAAPAYALLYAAALALGLPGTPLTLIGGAAFGLWPGLAINLAGALGGCSLAFFEARYLGHDTIGRLLRGRFVSLGSLDDPRVAFMTFARLRLIPLVPFNGVNFAAGLTHAGFGPYLGGTAIGILPSTVLWTYFADALVAGDASVRELAAGRLLVALVAIGVLTLAPSAVERVRRWRRNRALSSRAP